MSPYWYAQGCVSHTPCGLHGEVWVIDWYARQGYNGFIIIVSCER